MKEIESITYRYNKVYKYFEPFTLGITEYDGMLFEEIMYCEYDLKKWYEFYKKDTFTVVVKYRFIRAIRPSLKIILEC